MENRDDRDAHDHAWIREHAQRKAAWLAHLEHVTAELERRLTTPLADEPDRIRAEVGLSCASVNDVCAARERLLPWMRAGAQQDRPEVERHLTRASELITAAVERWMREIRHVMAHLAVDSLAQDEPGRDQRDRELCAWYTAGKSVYQSVTQCLSRADLHHRYTDARPGLGHLFAMLTWFAEAFPALARD